MWPFLPALPEVRKEADDLDSLSQTCNWGKQEQYDQARVVLYPFHPPIYNSDPSYTRDEAS